MKRMSLLKQTWRAYTLAWRQTFTLRSFATMGLDLFLLLGVLLTTILYTLLSGLVTHPLLPFLKAVEAGVPPPRAMVTGALVKLLLALALALLLFLILYSLVKRYSYDLLEKRAWSWHRWRIDLVITIVLALLVIIVPFLIMFLNPVVAAYTFVALLILIVLLLPLLYLKPVSWWRTRCRDPLPLIALWLLPNALLALLFFLHSFTLLALTFFVLITAVFTLILLFIERWMHALLLAVILLFITWFVGVQLLLALSLLSVWTALILSVIWLFLFFAFGRLFLITVVGGFR